MMADKALPVRIQKYLLSSKMLNCDDENIIKSPLSKSRERDASKRIKRFPTLTMLRSRSATCAEKE